MTTRTSKDISALFDAVEWAHIIEFGKRLSALQSDVAITMARKATCFVECLERLKLTTISATQTSDRVLDMDLEWLRGKTVTLVDDALVSGTTLYRAESAILAAGAKRVDTTVLCVDRDWWCRDLVRPSEPYLEIGDRETISLCAKVVDAIALLPLPYAVDFPLFADIRLAARDSDVATQLPGWSVEDVSSPLQREHDILALSLTPPRYVLADLDRSLGWHLSSRSLTKIRLHGRREHDGRLRIHATPFVVLPPVAAKELDELFHRLIENSGSASARWWIAFASETSQLRLIQYIAAARLARLWIKQVEESLGRELAARQDPRMLANLFAPPLVNSIRTLSQRATAFFDGFGREWAQPTLPRLSAPISRPLELANVDQWSLQAHLTSPFVGLYREKEMK